MPPVSRAVSHSNVPVIPAFLLEQELDNAVIASDSVVQASLHDTEAATAAMDEVDAAAPGGAAAGGGGGAAGRSHAASRRSSRGGRKRR